LLKSHVIDGVMEDVDTKVSQDGISDRLFACGLITSCLLEDFFFFFLNK